MRTACLAVSLSCLVGCFSLSHAPHPPGEYLPDESVVVRQELLRRVPYGTPIKKARATLEQDGYLCRNDRLNRVIVCERVEPTPKGSGTRRVQTWLHYDPA